MEKKMEVASLDISALKNANYNPPRRVKNSRKWKTLLGSMQENGLFYPILIDKNKNIIDGHRRVAVAKELKWDRIPCLVVNTADVLSAKIYADVNTTHLAQTGNDVLYVYLTESQALTPHQLSKVQQAEAVLGRKLLRQMYSKGKTLQVYWLAKDVAKYCEIDQPALRDAFIRQVVQWCFSYNSFTLRQAVASETPIKTIKKVIESNLPLKGAQTYSPGEKDES